MTLRNVVRVNSDYKLQTNSGGQITLDTGNNVGLVLITGNLQVQGDTTYINVVDMQIEDNIILLNRGETGAGVSEGTAGIEIDRGTNIYGNAQIFFDETQNWNDPATQTQRDGLFVFKTAAGGINGIQTNSIDTAGGDLYLISQGTGIISVSGTSNYEQQVLNYSSGLTPFDDDIVPNIKAVTDKISYDILNSPSDKIKRDDTQVIVMDNNITRFVETFDTGGSPSLFVTITHSDVTNLDIGIFIGKFVTIVGSGITNLDGTWQVVSAALGGYFFVISVSSAVTASSAANVGTITVENTKSNIKFQIDNIIRGEMQTTHADFYNLRIQDTTISANISNTDLILSSPGSGSVQIQDNLKMPYITPDPSPESNNVKLFMKAPDVGQSGVYFVNTQYKDELISRRKAVAFSILF